MYVKHMKFHLNELAFKCENFLNIVWELFLNEKVSLKNAIYGAIWSIIRRRVMCVTKYFQKKWNFRNLKKFTNRLLRRKYVKDRPK